MWAVKLWISLLLDVLDTESFQEFTGKLSERENR